MSKEYTYDIGKYTIGVDENGEDGIGLTISIIKNGEINFLGNCYGENAKCLDLLIKENQELKKQLQIKHDGFTASTDELEEYKFDHFKNIDEVMYYFNYWYKEEDVYSINRYLSLKDFNYISNKYQELKRQLEDANEKIILLQASEPMLNYKKALEETQQKEFIKWLENGIEKVKNTEFLDERIQRAGLIAYNRCLQKCKEIIGVSDENKRN